MTAQDGFVPWPAELAERYRVAGYWRGRLIGDEFRQCAALTPDTVALIDGATHWTYRELAAAVDLAASRLLDLDLNRGDSCVIHLPNRAEFVILTLACLRLGVVPVMALPPHRRTDIVALIQRTGARAYAVPSSYRGFDYLALAREVRTECPSLAHVLVLRAGDDDPGRTDLAALCRTPGDVAAATARVDALRSPASGDVALLLLSGGTTGTPKLIPRTHDDYVYNMRITAEVSALSADSVYLVALPGAHNFALGCPGWLGSLLTGAGVVLADAPSPEVVFPLIAAHSVTHTAVVPAVAHRWADATAAEPDSTTADLGSLSVLAVGGSRLAAELGRRIEPALGVRLQQAFGMGEGLACFTGLDDPAAVRYETQGRPLSPDDEIRIVDEFDRDVPAGAAGELITRGPYTLRGYYRAPEHDARAFTADGWYRTGDIVRLTAAGNVVVEGRNRDIINRGGEKISAEEVENLAYSHPDVADAAAVPSPDPVLGERVCLFVVPRSGAGPTLAGIRAHMEAAGASTLVLPEILRMVTTLPTTNVGKVDKKALRADAARDAEVPA